MPHESLDNPRRKAAICLVVFVLLAFGLGAALAERNRSSVSAELQAVRAEHRQLLARQGLLVRQAETLREQLAERSRLDAPAGRTTLQPRPRA